MKRTIQNNLICLYCRSRFSCKLQIFDFFLDRSFCTFTQKRNHGPMHYLSFVVLTLMLRVKSKLRYWHRRSTWTLKKTKSRYLSLLVFSKLNLSDAFFFFRTNQIKYDNRYYHIWQLSRGFKAIIVLYAARETINRTGRIFIFRPDVLAELAIFYGRYNCSRIVIRWAKPFAGRPRRG